MDQTTVTPPVIFPPIQKPLFYGCDVCMKKPLKDIRYHCNQCEDFDLCKECFEKGALPTGAGTTHTSDHDLTALQLPMERHKLNGTAIDSASSMGGSGFLGPGLKLVPVDPKKAQAQENTSSSITPKSTTSSVYDQANGRKRRRTTKPAGAAMDRMNDILSQASIGPLPLNQQSTQISQDFLKFYDAGKVAFQDTIGEDEKRGDKLPPVDMQIIALNSMEFLSLISDSGKSRKTKLLKISSDLNTVDHLAAVLQATLSQFMVADEEQWFSVPVNTNHCKDYLAKISSPVDISKIKTQLEKLLSVQDRVQARPEEKLAAIFMEIEGSLSKVWSNATTYNPPDHLVYVKANEFRDVCSKLFERIQHQLGIEIAMNNQPSRMKSASKTTKRKYSDRLEVDSDSYQELLSEVVALRAEVKRANTRIDKLVKIVGSSFFSMAERVNDLSS